MILMNCLKIFLQGIVKTVNLLLDTQHALMVENLPPYHKDLFDRMLIAQAQVEKLRLITGDLKIKAYSVSIIEA